MTRSRSSATSRACSGEDRPEAWTAPAIHDAVNQAAAELTVGMGKVAQPIRVAVSGTSVSPPIDITLEVLGRETTLSRLAAALAYAQSGKSAA